MVWKLSLWFVPMQRIRWRERLESISLSGTKWFGSDINDQINYPLLLSTVQNDDSCSVTIFYKSRNAYQIVVEKCVFIPICYLQCLWINHGFLPGGGQSSINGCSWFFSFSQMSNKSPIQNIDYSRFLLFHDIILGLKLVFLMVLFLPSFGIMKASKESKNTLSFKGIAEWTSIKGWDKPKREEQRNTRWRKEQKTKGIIVNGAKLYVQKRGHQHVG